METSDAPRRRLRDAVYPTDESHRVTPLELFFDLVFVFAFTQVTQLMADDPTSRGAARGLVLMALLWWAGARTRGSATRPGPTPEWSAPRWLPPWPRCSSLP